MQETDEKVVVPKILLRVSTGKEMSGSARVRRVTDPLDDKARARLVGGGNTLSYLSSGSEHSADNDSPRLSELVHGFLEDDDSNYNSPGYESDSEPVDSAADRTHIAEDVLLRLTDVNNLDSYGTLLYGHVSKAIEAYSCWSDQKSVLRREVMTFLRELGHNAAICKTKWDASGGLTAGNYEFIDVVQSVSSTSQNRYIADLDFASQFEIARPTSQYAKLLQALPRAFVGKSEDLKKIVKAMCDAARASLKSRDLSLPPWRKNRYMQNKWFGPYRRTSNSAPSSSLTPIIAGVKCRCVGFDDSVNRHLIVHTR